jgi:hypothetical protein
MPLDEPTDIWRGLPPFARAVFMLGAPTVAAAWLIYVMTTTVVANVQTIKSELERHVQNDTVIQERANEYRVAQEIKLDTLIRIATQQCVNAASDVTQRRDCLNAGGR